MDLFEYQGKQLFASFGIPVSAGEPVDTVEDAVTAANDLGYPVVVKAQVQVGGRLLQIDFAVACVCSAGNSRRR